VAQHVVVIAEASAAELADLDIVLAPLFLEHLAMVLYRAHHHVATFIDQPLILARVVAFPVCMVEPIQIFLKYMVLMLYQIS
jgi:hypothetical protein